MNEKERVELGAIAAELLGASEKPEYEGAFVEASRLRHYAARLQALADAQPGIEISAQERLAIMTLRHEVGQLRHTGHHTNGDEFRAARRCIDRLIKKWGGAYTIPGFDPDAEPDREAVVERMKGQVQTEPAKEGDNVVTHHGARAGVADGDTLMPTIRLRAAQISQAEGGVRVGDNYFFAGEWRRNPMSTTRDAIGIEDRITKRFETLGD